MSSITRTFPNRESQATESGQSFCANLSPSIVQVQVGGTPFPPSSPFNLQSKSIELFESLSFFVQKMGRSIQACYQEAISNLKDFFIVPAYFYMARRETWDPASAFLKDKRMKTEWSRLFAKGKKQRKVIERKTSQLFLKDVMRASYYLGQVQSRVEPGLVNGQEPQENAPSVASLNEHWCRFLKMHIDPQLKKPLSEVKVNLLRYQLQDIVNQRLFMLSDALFPKLVHRYIAAGCVATSSEELLEYQCKSQGSQLIVQCNKIFTIYNQATLKLLGYDMLSIEVAIDLRTFIPDRLLTKQPNGCVTGTVTQTGFSTVVQKAAN